MTLYISLSKRFPGFDLDVRFDSSRGPIALLGPSGSGKTLTLRAIAGLLRPDSGRIALGDRVLFDSSAGINVPCNRRRVGFVFQSYALFPHLTVAQNVAYGLAGLSPAERDSRVHKQLNKMRLTDVANALPGSLSGGQQQRVALARALAPDPDLLLLDEPLAALDLHLRAEVEKHLVETLAEYRGTALFVSHNLAEAYRLCPQLVVLVDGRAAAIGATRDIFQRPPTRGVARVTGCKNFSRIRVASPSAVEALDWNCTLQVLQPPGPAAHVAIRAHHLRVAASSSAPADAGTAPTNRFACWLASAIEGPFDVTLYLCLNAAPSGPADFHLQAEVTREQWDCLRTAPAPWSVTLDPDALMLLPE